MPFVDIACFVDSFVKILLSAAFGIFSATFIFFYKRTKPETRQQSSKFFRIKARVGDEDSFFQRYAEFNQDAQHDLYFGGNLIEVVMISGNNIRKSEWLAVVVGYSEDIGSPGSFSMLIFYFGPPFLLGACEPSR